MNNRWKKVPEFSTEIIPTAQHPNHSEKCLEEQRFHTKELIRKSKEDARKDTTCQDLLQQAATSSVPFPGSCIMPST